MVLQILTASDPHSMKNILVDITINGNYRLHTYTHTLSNSTRGQDTRRNTVIIIFLFIKFL